jgi:hypothetical protein
VSASSLSGRSLLLAAPLAALAIAASTAAGIASGSASGNQQTFAQKYVTVVGLEGRPVTSARSFLEAALEASDLAGAASTDRRIVLALVRRRAGDGDVTGVERLIDALRAARASLWTLEIAPAAEGRGAAPAGGPRPAPSRLDDVLTLGAQLGGGLRETLASVSTLPDHAGRVARLLLSQYVVTYAWPDPMIGQFCISTRHDRGTVLSPVWDR